MKFFCFRFSAKANSRNCKLQFGVQIHISLRLTDKAMYINRGLLVYFEQLKFLMGNVSVYRIV